MTAEQQTERTELESARAALRMVADLGELEPDRRLQLLASGVEIGKAQRAYLLHAQTLALVSIAGSLERLLDELERGR